MQNATRGISLDYEVTGKGPWLVLSHSLTTDRSMWDAQMPTLEKYFRVLRYDMRGHGHSAAPAAPYAFADLVADVLGLMDAVGAAKAHFAGVSIGGMIGQHLALAAPARVDRLILANTTSRIPPEGVALWEERIAAVAAQGVAPLVASTLQRWFTEPYRKANPVMMARVGTLIAATSTNGYIGCGRAIQTLNFTERLSAIAAPTLVISGVEDPGTPPAAGEAIAKAIPGAQFIAIARASHMACIEQADTFTGLMTGFLAG